MIIMNIIFENKEDLIENKSIVCDTEQCFSVFARTNDLARIIEICDNFKTPYTFAYQNGVLSAKPCKCNQGYKGLVRFQK